MVWNILRQVNANYTENPHRRNWIDASIQLAIMRKMSKKRFSRFESIAQRLIEGSLTRLLGGRPLTREAINHLAEALEDSQVEANVANRYQIRMHPADYAEIHEETPDVSSRLSTHLRELARQAGLTFAGELQLVLVADKAILPQKVVVHAWHEPAMDGATRSFKRSQLPVEAPLETLDAFLIVNGRRHVPLDKSVITIGRRTDNDVIVDSPLVSRQHAHIRWRYGRFVLYDAGSRGGVRVNGEPCREWVLQPGDLITLAEQVSLIYGEGLERRDAPPSENGSDEQSTLALEPERRDEL